MTTHVTLRVSTEIADHVRAEAARRKVKPAQVWREVMRLGYKEYEARHASKRIQAELHG